MPQTVPFDDTLLATHLVVDVRTPLEFAEDHIPGAINVPLLSNEERVEIGTLYKQTGPQVARVRGLELVAPRFPAMVAEIANAAAGRTILVYCWRGGLRSRTVAEILDLTGYRAVQLKGGYKAFRTHVAAYFEPFSPPGPLVVLHGMTGIGKTSFLLGLVTRDAFGVVDLEGLARHRGSAFGELGIEQDVSQKRFETLLWDAFRRMPAQRPILVEGESRRIGRLSLPGTMYDEMRASVKVWCEASVPTRLSRLMAEYGRDEYHAGMADALERIKRKLGGVHYGELRALLVAGDVERFIAGLIEHYYDRLYYKNRDWQEDFTLSLEDLAAAGALLEDELRRRFPS